MNLTSSWIVWKSKYSMTIRLMLGSLVFCCKISLKKIVERAEKRINLSSGSKILTKERSFTWQNGFVSSQHFSFNFQFQISKNHVWEKIFIIQQELLLWNFIRFGAQICWRADLIMVNQFPLHYLHRSFEDFLEQIWEFCGEVFPFRRGNIQDVPGKFED